MNILSKTLFILSCTGLTAACGNSGSSYSMLSTAQSFKQTVNSKIDLLWVVDNSGSMQPLQDNMTQNFNSFISNFISKGYDFHLAVTSSDAFDAYPQFRNLPNMARFSDGVSTHTGVFTILPDTMNLISTFVTNATLGTNGSGDERAFSSFRAALDSPLNAGFLRDGSFLAIVILSDEDDFSDPARPEFSWTQQGGIADHSYTNPGLETIESYVSYLEGKTNSMGATRRFSVSSLAILDNACRQAYAQRSPSAIVGKRYIDLANATDGVLGSVCDASYANSLIDIQKKIIELSTQFYLQGAPVESSIRVSVDGVNIPNDAVNGWTYNPDANSVVFHGAAVPPSGANVNVSFDPKKLGF